MTNISLDEFSQVELKALEKRIERELEARSERKRREKAVSEATAIAQKYGYTLAQLVGEPRKLRGARIPPKYKNPANSLQTWSGRGRQPLWVRDHVNAGGELSDLLIKQA